MCLGPNTLVILGKRVHHNVFTVGAAFSMAADRLFSDGINKELLNDLNSIKKHPLGPVKYVAS